MALITASSTASLSPTGDIFISYRQKDNNGDGWVTEIASNLIVSYTYFVPKSFALQYKFLAFKKTASIDQLGHVTSSIVPICTHQLDPADKQMFEEELGGVLRGIDSIYRTSDLVRPLKTLQIPITHTTVNKLTKLHGRLGIDHGHSKYNVTYT